MVKGLLLSVAMQQAIVMAQMKGERDSKYAIASQLAHEIGGPLLVVGGPYGSNRLRHTLSLKAHGAGDV